MWIWRWHTIILHFFLQRSFDLIISFFCFLKENSFRVKNPLDREAPEFFPEWLTNKVQLPSSLAFESEERAAAVTGVIFYSPWQSYFQTFDRMVLKGWVCVISIKYWLWYGMMRPGLVRDMTLQSHVYSCFFPYKFAVSLFWNIWFIYSQNIADR